MSAGSVSMPVYLCVGAVCAGETGDKGAKGDTGDTGAVGPAGPQGPAGKDDVCKCKGGKQPHTVNH